MGEPDRTELDMGRLLAFTPKRRGARPLRAAREGAVLLFTGVRRERFDAPALAAQEKAAAAEDVRR